MVIFREKYTTNNLKEEYMPKKKPRNIFPCDEFPDEIRNALAESADNYDTSSKEKKSAGKVIKSY